MVDQRHINQRIKEPIIQQAEEFRFQNFDRSTVLDVTQTFRPRPTINPLQSKEFLTFCLESLSKNGTAYLPELIPANDINYLIGVWNKKLPFHAHQLSCINQQVSGAQLCTAGALYGLRAFVTPIAGLPKELSSKPILLPHPVAVKPTTPFTDTTFRKWLTNNLEKNPTVRLRTQDGLISQNDLDVLVGLFRKAHPESLMDNPARRSILGSMRIEKAFPGVTVRLALPALSESLIPVALHFAGKTWTPLNDTQRMIVEAIKSEYAGIHSKTISHEALRNAVLALVPYAEAKSPIAHLAIDFLQEERNACCLRKQEIQRAKAQGRNTLNGKSLTSLEDAANARELKIEVQFKHLPKGAYNIYLTRKKDLNEGELIKTLDSETLLANAFKDSARGKLVGLHGSNFDVMYVTIRDYQGKSCTELFSKLHAIEPLFSDVTFKPLLKNLAVAKEYIKVNSENGVIDQPHFQVARYLLEVNQEQIKNVSKIPSDITSQANNLYCEHIRITEGLGKATVIAGQLVGTGFAIASQSYWALPMVWFGPYAAASVARAGIEDTSLIDAAAKQWKIDQIFGTPGSVCAEFLKGSESTGWKLMLLDFITCGGLEAAASGAPTRWLAKGFKLSTTEREILTKIGKNRLERPLTAQEIAGIEVQFGEACANGTMNHVIQVANEALHGKEIPPHLKALLDSQSGKLQPVAPGLSPGQILNIDLSHMGSSLSDLLNSPQRARIIQAERAILEGGQKNGLFASWEKFIVDESGHVSVITRGSQGNLKHLSLHDFTLEYGNRRLKGEIVFIRNQPITVGSAGDIKILGNGIEPKSVRITARSEKHATGTSEWLDIKNIGSKPVTVYRKVGDKLQASNIAPTGKVVLKEGERIEIGDHTYQAGGGTLLTRISEKNWAFPNGVEYLKFIQGQIGNCYLLASVYALSRKTLGKQFLNDIFVSRSSLPNARRVNLLEGGSRIDERYRLRFFDDQGNKHFIDVTLGETEAFRRRIATERYGQGSRGVSGGIQGASGQPEIGLSVLEYAYDKFRKEILHEGRPKSGYFASEGGFTEKSFTHLTGQPSKTRGEFGIPLVDYLATKGKTGEELMAELFQYEHEKGYILTAGSLRAKSDSNLIFEKNGQRIVGKHAYQISVFGSPGHYHVAVRNPHNTSDVIRLTPEEFITCFTRIAGTKLK